MRPSRGASLRPVVLLAAAFTALELIFSSRYGYHRDELYFLVIGGHPAFGYVDQPPLVPLLAHALDAAGHHLWLLRLPSALAGGAVVLLTGLVAREFGADRRGQTFAAACMAACGVLMGSAHLASTTTYDLLLWAAMTLTLLRALRLGGPRWLLLGLLAGIALEIKTLPAFFLLALLIGLLVAGPREPLRTPWLAGGALVGAALWAPNLVWQASHGWPQLELAKAIASGGSGTSSSRAGFVPNLLLQVGPPLAPFWIAGLVRLVRDARWRFLAVAYGLLLVFFVVTGGKPYYLVGIYPVLFAAAAEPVLGWARGRRRVLVPLLVVLSAVPVAVITLPIVPAADLHATPIVAINYDSGEQIGWPRFAATVAAEAERAHAPVITGNYGEDGAIAHYRPDIAVFGTQNSLWALGPPPGDPSTVIAVGFDRADLAARFAHVTQVATIDNGLDVDNDEQGMPVWRCSGPRQPVSVLWRALRHLG
ncbi:MAG: ArnT family glycosyltransferase [Jatrophihabitans sp.]|uniref:ArnT family glycosyltransferase n=1 Tax=Jatrophihabitans sp. TaxID=1932789 RepID=UPI003F7FDFC3